MNFNVNKEIILASTSPRRQELLSLLGVPFIVVDSEVVEQFEAEPNDLEKYVRNLAIKKAMQVSAKEKQKVVIGADTIVSLNGRVLPKPADDLEAKTFLQSLSGNTHQVYTAVALVHQEEVDSFIVKTEVTFYPLEEAMIDAYVATGDPLDKAGGYGIQSEGALFVEAMRGDYYAVMGLPIAKLTQLLLEKEILAMDNPFEALL